MLANSDLAPGANRLILGLIDSASFPLGSPAWALKSEIFDITADGCTPLAAASPLPFAWAITDVRGFFIGTTEIPVGAREIGLVISGTDATGATVLVRFTSFVQSTGTAPRPGDPAPTVATPLAATSPQGVAGVSTDPDPRRACGPTLTLLKSAADRHPGVVIVHVEPYQMSWNGTRLIPVLAAGGGLQATSIVTAWQVPVEPWIFTVGGDGRILRSIEGIVSPEELDAALAELAAN